MTDQRPLPDHAATTDKRPFAARVGQLLGDARRARQDGDATALLALTDAVFALDPGNAEARALREGNARRRQMTLMFCDLVGSTAIADSRDPEDMSAILRGYRSLCTEVVQRHGGFVDDHQGDGMLVLFGYPEVGEDDVQRAVRCGLELVRSIRRAAGPTAAGLRLRVAVHTDLVVLDGIGVAGATANEAARIQGLTEPDTVVISDATEVIVRGLFDTESRGLVALRGVSRPVEIFTVLAERSGPRPAGPAAPSPFVGRRAELALLADAWRALTDGSATTSARPGLLVTGPAGIGKSRLFGEAAHRLGAASTECRCSRYHRGTSLFPVRPLLEQACGIERDDDTDRRLAKLRQRLGQRRDGGGDLPFLAAALQIPTARLAPEPEVDPARLRERAMQAAAGLVLECAAHAPQMVIIDDLQWADHSTLDLIALLLTAPHPGLLLLLAARDGFGPQHHRVPWPDGVLSTIRLDRLNEEEQAELADRILGGAPIPPAQRAELIHRSDGIPLFLEELVRTAEALRRDRVVHRSIRLSEHHIPAALRDPLLARLAAGGVDLALAQLAATIGRDVDRALLRRAAGLTESELAAGLDGLIAAELVEPLSDGVVRFRHELIREVAYETQSRRVQRERHGRIADHLLANHPFEDTTAGDLDVGPVAFHLERAQRHPEAIEITLRAAAADQAVGAHAEAIRRATDALALLEHVPAGAERDGLELRVRELRGFSSVATGGYAAPEAATDHRRCLELCERAGRTPELLPSLIRTWSYFTFRGDLREADRTTDRIEAIGLGELSSVVAEAGRGVNNFFRGRFDASRRRVDAFVEHRWGHHPGRPPLEWPLPHDPMCGAGVLLVPILWIMGEPDASAAAAERALRRARSLAFPYGPFSLGYVQHFIAVTHRMAGDHDAASRQGDELLQLGERHGFTLWKLAGAIHRGLSAAWAGQPGALDRLTEDVCIWRMLLVADLWSPYWLTELAGAQAAAGRHDSALRLLDDAVGLAETTGSTFYSAETLRRRGELRHARGDRAGVTDMLRARAVAREQGAIVFRIRIEDALRSGRAAELAARPAHRTRSAQPIRRATG